MLLQDHACWETANGFFGTVEISLGIAIQIAMCAWNVDILLYPPIWSVCLQLPFEILHTRHLNRLFMLEKRGRIYTQHIELYIKSRGKVETYWCIYSTILLQTLWKFKKGDFLLRKFLQNQIKNLVSALCLRIFVHARGNWLEHEVWVTKLQSSSTAYFFLQIQKVVKLWFCLSS